MSTSSDEPIVVALDCVRLCYSEMTNEMWGCQPKGTKAQPSTDDKLHTFSSDVITAVLCPEFLFNKAWIGG